MTEYKKAPGLIRWTIIDTCNNRCSYCVTPTESKASNVRVKEYDRYLDVFKQTIPRGWNFDLIGGEATIHPNFMDIVQGLVDGGYTISLSTNFTLPQEKLVKFFEITGEQCLAFKASLHMESVKVEDYLDKLFYLYEKFPNARIIGTSVALPEKLPLLLKVAETVKKKNGKFHVQRCRDKNNKQIEYTKEENRTIREINKWMQPVFQYKKEDIYRPKKSCYCGFKLAHINPFGEVYRCHPYKSQGKSIGNVLDDGFALFDGPRVCEEPRCYCNEGLQIETLMEKGIM